jgi:micrococcal nuclease
MKLFGILASIFMLTTSIANLSGGKVIDVHDGDSFTYLIGKVSHKIRLKDIDAPELGQDFGKVAKQKLKEYLNNKTLKIVVTDTDRNGRLIADVYANNILVNEYLVKNGYAMVYEKYCKNPELYNWQAKAKQAKLGLWIQPNPVAPEVYRKLRKKKKDN